MTEPANTEHTADAVLFERVYIPAFVKECQARGLQIGDREQLSDLLKVAHTLRVRAAAEQSAAAETTGQAVKAAAAWLVRDTYGDRPQAGSGQADVSDLLRDPEVAAAAAAVVGA